MRNRKRVSLFDRVCSKIFNWAKTMLIEAIPVIGPIYTVVTLVNDVHTAARKRRRACAAA